MDSACKCGVNLNTTWSGYYVSYRGTTTLYGLSAFSSPFKQNILDDGYACNDECSIGCGRRDGGMNSIKFKTIIIE